MHAPLARSPLGHELLAGSALRGRPNGEGRAALARNSRGSLVREESSMFCVARFRYAAVCALLAIPTHALVGMQEQPVRGGTLGVRDQSATGRPYDGSPVRSVFVIPPADTRTNSKFAQIDPYRTKSKSSAIWASEAERRCLRQVLQRLSSQRKVNSTNGSAVLVEDTQATSNRIRIPPAASWSCGVAPRR